MVCFVDIGGLIFLWNAPAWAPDFYIGHDQFGDADFWWQGVLEMSQAILGQHQFYLSHGLRDLRRVICHAVRSKLRILPQFLVAIFLATASAL